jgi:hypothetical protein
MIMVYRRVERPVVINEKLSRVLTAHGRDIDGQCNAFVLKGGIVFEVNMSDDSLEAWYGGMEVYHFKNGKVLINDMVDNEWHSALDALCKTLK